MQLQEDESLEDYLERFLYNYQKSKQRDQLLSLLDNMVEEEERIVDEEPKDEQTFRFPILDRAPNVVMKNINPSILPTFHGMTTKEPDAFLFKFDILCRS